MTSSPDWVKRSAGYSSFVFIVQWRERGGGVVCGGVGGVQSHHHNLNALDAQTPPVTTDEKIFPSGEAGQGHVWAVHTPQSYWPVRCLLSD